LDEQAAVTLRRISADIDRLRRRIKEIADSDFEQLRPAKGHKDISFDCVRPLARNIRDTLDETFRSSRRTRYTDTSLLTSSYDLYRPSWFTKPGILKPFDEILPIIKRRFDDCREVLELAIKDLKEETLYMTSSVNSEQIEGRSKSANPKVFVVHGHDRKARGDVALFLGRLKLEAIIIQEEASRGLTIIEQFERYADQAGFAVVLLTPDDVGGVAQNGTAALRDRQNVIFELGYFVAKLGRRSVCLLRKGDVEIPSDLHGVIYKRMDNDGGWKYELLKELIAAEMPASTETI
jgi:predicted nucleotide-binding protein